MSKKYHKYNISLIAYNDNMFTVVATSKADAIKQAKNLIALTSVSKDPWEGFDIEAVKQEEVEYWKKN